jgi:hypothetical protein
MEINYLAVVLAGLSASVLGFIWYTILFQKVWLRLIGMSEQNIQAASQGANVAKQIVGSLILEIVMAFNLAMFIGPDKDWTFGLGAGVAAGFGWVGLAFGINYMFEGKSFKLWLINAGYNTVVFAVMGVIIGAMN